MLLKKRCDFCSKLVDKTHVRGAAAVLGLLGGEGARGRRRVPLAAGGRIRTGLTALLAIPNYK